jgi:predicted site-specific integrase-resolvase
MKLSVWAERQGISYKTAWRWFKAGTLPVRAEQMPSGTVIIYEDEAPSAAVALYARVSSHEQKDQLAAQLGRLSEYASKEKLVVIRSISEIGSGLNGHRPKLMKLLRDPAISAIVVEHRDRLMRFGSEYVDSALAAQGRRIIVVNVDEMKDDLVRDMIEVLTSFCARLYGRRSSRNRAKKAVEAIESASDD